MVLKQLFVAGSILETNNFTCTNILQSSIIIFVKKVSELMLLTSHNVAWPSAYSSTRIEALGYLCDLFIADIYCSQPAINLSLMDI